MSKQAKQGYANGSVEAIGYRDDLNNFQKLGLFDAKIVSKSEEKNSKGYFYYYIQWEVMRGKGIKATKKALVTSPYEIAPGTIVAVDLINWRDNATKKYNLFLTIIPPVDFESEESI